MVEIRIDRGDAPNPFESFVQDIKNGSIGDPRLVLVGVVATTQSDFQLSEKALEDFAWLQKQVGRYRVLLRTISAKQVPEGLRIHCRTPGSKDKGKSVTTPIY
ncbi:MAG TPA: hypothetical protein VFM63_06760 [Pyrinomonadaceae bacterium]|nr:hypothetical protein [Pyrinomonadaceae bacterium]